MSRPINHLYEFGPFRLIPDERLLLRDGQHVPLTPKAFETLLALVENDGHVIDKEGLLKKVWPDTLVEEVNLAKNISYLRKVLGGEPSEQYIETIPRRGYRFAANVKEVWGEQAGIVTAVQSLISAVNQEERTNGLSEQPGAGSGLEPAHGMSAISPRLMSSQLLASRLGWLIISLVLGLAFSVAFWVILSRSGTKTPAPPSKIVPFTSFPGKETHATFSPDGNQIAFVWDGVKGGNPDIYVKLIGIGHPLRLTTHSAADTHPTWSPDGRYIAFFRQTTESSGFYLIPALGGPERKVADVFLYRNPSGGNTQYYSPDGKFLAVSDKNSQEEPFSIYLLSVETGDKRKVTSPPLGTVGDAYPAFSPDGKMLAFLRSSGQATTDLHLVPVAGGESQRLTFDHTSILGLAWTTDGREIVFASRRGSSGYNLWRISVRGGAPERLPTIGQSVLSPAISRQGNLLAYSQTVDDQNIWRLELDATGRGLAPTSLISSTLDDNGPHFSPDGQKVVFASNRSGEFGIWVCDRTGANPMLLAGRGTSLTGTPRWSPDGRWIAFDSRSNDSGQQGNADIYVISAEGGQPRRLTSELSEDVVPSWSRDGKWIYFGSTRSGSMQIWKIPVEGGQALQVTREGGFEGFESTDGKLLYYAKGRAIPGIWQIPVGGGEETLLLDHHKAGYWRLWAVAEKGIYFATANVPSHPIIEFFSFATRKVIQVSTLDKPLSRSEPGLAISPDTRTLLFPQLDQSGSDIMLVENFR